jgi:UDP-N-acetylmuramate--alanine ligase
MSDNTCHFIGIGGIGMSALAKICLGKKYLVTGSDISLNNHTEHLKTLGATIYTGHLGRNIAPKTTVIYSSSVKENNPEYEAAVFLSCHMMHRSEFLSHLMQDYKALTVTGTHGKTTTSALLTKVFKESELDPAFAIGGVSLDFQTNGSHGAGEFFLAEADESDGTFLKYPSYGAIITNIDSDHMDYFKTAESLYNAFKTFCINVTSRPHLFYCGDDVNLNRIMKENGINGVSYGFSSENKLVIKNYRQVGWSSFFDIEFQEEIYQNIELSLIGEHNALNAAAVFGLSLACKIPLNIIRAAFQTFKGVSRRSEKKFYQQGVLMVDDYAHHPTEIKATLKGIRSAILERKLIAVFQPHRYSRTQDVLSTLNTCFDDASEIIVTDIYAAGEAPIEGVTHENILNELKHVKIPVKYIPRDELAKQICGALLPHDVVVSLGAGDITKLSSEILHVSKITPIRKMKIGICFGGKSFEHEISIRSFKYIASCLNLEIYEPYYFGISKEGCWVFNPDMQSKNSIFAETPQAISTEIMSKLNECDLFFPVLHGSFGEDGTIQGLFEMIGKPYVGCDYRASAICMDKIFTKQLMVLNNIKTSDFMYFTHAEWKINADKIMEDLLLKFSFPLYIKPAHLGSSIGVSRAENKEQIKNAIHLSFNFDNKVIVESEVKGREIEFAVLGNDSVEVYGPGEIETHGKLYDYDLKYISNDMKTTPKALLSEEVRSKGVELAKKAYIAAGCKGLSRVDFFLDSQNTYWLNEINPIPGFTSISLYPEMCASDGLKGADLIDRLIILGLEKNRTKQAYEF